jgi:hypothetical protein
MALIDRATANVPRARIHLQRIDQAMQTGVTLRGDRTRLNALGAQTVPRRRQRTVQRVRSVRGAAKINPAPRIGQHRAPVQEELNADRAGKIPQGLEEMPSDPMLPTEITLNGTIGQAETSEPSPHSPVKARRPKLAGEEIAPNPVRVRPAAERIRISRKEIPKPSYLSGEPATSKEVAGSFFHG